MNIAALLLTNALASKVKSFKDSTKDPIKAQEKVLFEFIKRNKDTLYGRERSFDRINSVADYQKNVTIGTYKEFEPYVKRLIGGEKKILTVDTPLLFGTTSGTTGAPKFLPVTEYSRKKKADVMNLWVYHIIKDYPSILDGKIMAIVSPEVEKCTARGLPCGAETGHAYKNFPYAIRRFYALPYPVFEIEDYEAKYYCILRLSMEQDIRTLATMNPSTIILLCQKVEEFKDSIIEDIEKGTINKRFNMGDKIRAIVEKKLKPNPRQANFLRNLLQQKGRLLPCDFWPNLKLIECWKGGTVGLYLKEFPKYFKDVPIRDFGYLSSEARCSIPTDNNKCCGILAINANFYEFIPKEDKEKQDKRVLLCNQLQIGAEYFVIITTPGGLYRYDIDDVIRVTGFENKTPRIEFTQKGLNVTSITGEKLYESQVVKAVSKAVQVSGVSMEFFTACIQWDRVPRYVFLVEFRDNPSHESKKDLLKFIDSEIRGLNVEYEGKRRSQRLDDPILKVVKRGAFHKYRIKRVAGGSHDGQFKVPQLTKDLEFQENFDIEEEVYLKK